MTDSRRIRWGLLGAARITKSDTCAICASRKGELAAIAARDPARARAFAADQGIPRLADYFDICKKGLEGTCNSLGLLRPPWVARVRD